MKYKALLLDLDDTLTMSSKVYDKALRFGARFLSERYNLDEQKFYDSVLEKHLIVHRTFPTVHTRHSRILVYRMTLDEYMEDYDLALLPDVEDMYWDYFMKNLDLYPGVLETLKKVKEAGVLTAIVSDGDLSLRIRKAHSQGLLEYIDEVVASEEVIFEKPFSAIFTLALSRLKVQPSEAIMLGNNYKCDVRGAQLVGIRSGIYNPAEDAHVEGQDGTIEEDFEIKAYAELLTELGIE